jgi:hypothetical protein
VVGIGINANVPLSAFEPAIRETAISLSAVGGRPVDRVLLARCLIRALDTWYGVLSGGDLPLIQERWLQLCATVGRHLSMEEHGRRYDGVVVDVSPTEGLALRLEAEGAPAEGEKIELLLGGKTFAFAPGEEMHEASFPRQLEVDERGWRALAFVDWKELSLEWGHLPAELAVQVSRVRDEGAYVWSPPMGTFWTAHGKRQGPGKLLLVLPSEDAATSGKQ